tara:strand:+ start:110 stop:727 length:618 start_codon:yes stop_codon:yes gene_type:complete
MAMNKATDIFSDWALEGRDIGMENNHTTAVNKMLKKIINFYVNPFSFVDAGCGNGWVVRKMSNHPLCIKSIGVDGALEMIKKAKKIDPNGAYIHSELMEWVPDDKVDCVHSMEVIYYFTEPKKIISHIVENWLKSNGLIIMGLDYYAENLKSHSWPSDLNTNMTLLSKNEWMELFNSCGLINTSINQVNPKGDFPGTLVVNGIKT